MNVHVSTLMEKEVSRKEFLSMSGLAIASLLGFGTIIQLVTGKSLLHGSSHQVVSGYGSSSYGGNQD